jgi:hypothetical protein
LLGNGDGTFRSVQTYGVGGVSPRSLSAGYFNGDGRPDLAVASYDKVTILLGNWNGTFTLRPSVSALFTYQLGTSPVNLLTVGDFNGDHKDDLAVVNPSPTKNFSYTAQLRVFLSYGNGSFKISARKLPVVTLGHSIAVGEFNRDGNQDLIVVGYQAASVLIGNGLGAFQVEP